MAIVDVVLFVLCVLGGSAKLVSGIWATAPPSEKHSRRLTGTVAILAGLFGLVFLWRRIASPADILVGSMLVLLLMEVAAANWIPKDRAKSQAVAYDLTSGELLGDVITECRNWRTSEIDGFKIKTPHGLIIERAPRTIQI